MGNRTTKWHWVLCPVLWQAFLVLSVPGIQFSCPFWVLVPSFWSTSTTLSVELPFSLPNLPWAGEMTHFDFFLAFPLKIWFNVFCVCFIWRSFMTSHPAIPVVFWFWQCFHSMIMTMKLWSKSRLFLYLSWLLPGCSPKKKSLSLQFCSLTRIKFIAFSYFSLVWYARWYLKIVLICISY